MYEDKVSAGISRMQKYAMGDACRSSIMVAVWEPRNIFEPKRIWTKLNARGMQTSAHFGIGSSIDTVEGISGPWGSKNVSS